MKRYILSLIIIIAYVVSLKSQDSLLVTRKIYKSQIVLRVYDKKTGKWSVDPEKQRIIKLAARRYLNMDHDPDYIKRAIFELRDSSILVSNSFVRKDYQNGSYTVQELYINDINMIKSNYFRSGLGLTFLGALAGFGIGALTSRIIMGPHTPGGWLDFYDEAIVASGILGAGVGAITGGIIGSIKIKIPINGSMDKYNRNKKKLGRYTVKYTGAPKY